MPLGTPPVYSLTVMWFLVSYALLGATTPCLACNGQAAASRMHCLARPEADSLPEGLGFSEVGMHTLEHGSTA